QASLDGLTCRTKRGLGSVPVQKWSVIITARGKQSGVEPNARALRGGMHADVDCGMRNVHQVRALVKAEGGVTIAQHQSRQAPSLEFLAQAASQRQGDVLFGQLIGECSPTLTASMAGI